MTCMSEPVVTMSLPDDVYVRIASRTKFDVRF